MKFVVIGGIAAGMSAAVRIKKNMPESEVTIFEKHDYVSFGACGLPYFVGDFFQNPDNMIARTKAQFEKTGVVVKTLHEVLEVDPQAKSLKVCNLTTGEEFGERYDRLLLATGATPLIPPIEGTDNQNVFTLHTLDDGHALKTALKEAPGKIAVIGGGFIGLEMLEAAENLGLSADLFELGDRILEKTFDREITDILEAHIRSKGFGLYVKETVKAIEQADGGKLVIKTDKGAYEAAYVVLCAGVKPNTAFLKDTGIEMLPNGAIVVDTEGRTSIPDIWSAGDCATVYHRVSTKNVFIPLATTANKLGRVVGNLMSGKDDTFPGTLGSAAIKVLDLETARTGLTEEEAKNYGFDYAVSQIVDKNHTNYYPNQTDITIRLIYEKGTRKILGGQITGENGAVLRIDVIATAIFAGLTCKELGMMDFCYSPPFSRTWDALNLSGNVSK
jgi:NADPH-dependent 2,4-dienoyl-CoA reductase/sulfur reductase-like enzyme